MRPPMTTQAITSAQTVCIHCEKTIAAAMTAQSRAIAAAVLHGVSTDSAFTVFWSRL
ncbi:hypothetical protein D9M69_706940 [compost metagenome]